MSVLLPERWLRLMPSGGDRELRLVRGDGVDVWDDEGRKYVDLDCGGGEALLGHRQKSVVEALQHQLGLLTVAGRALEFDAKDELIESLSLITPLALSHVALLPSGGAAVDAAVRAARTFTRRTAVIAMAGSPRPLQRDVVRVPFGDVDALVAALDETIAAVIVEPLQIETGVHPLPRGALQSIAAECERWGALLVVDEVQTALRTGTALACSRDHITPDLLCLGRGLAGGLPLGVLVVRPAVQRRLRREWWSATEANPLVCAAAAATVRIAANPTLQAHAGAVGDHLLARLAGLRLAEIRDVRGRGMLVGVELRHNAAPVLRALERRGVLAMSGPNGVVRMLPPLILERRQADAVVETLAAAIRDCRKERARNDRGGEITLPGVRARPVRARSESAS